ncbi:MAG: DUF3857 and transglutaminase domain-containing protein, partial [Candidatus Omnitrophica bacterium]|nr:DUF3857 and transglutaminase domain-containing protein [Candidatus Omnitrophota bacterium]
PQETRRIYWRGKTDIQTSPYELYTVWYTPGGEVYSRGRCRWKGTADYTASLKLPRKKGQELLGQWHMEIQDREGEVLLNNRFYIGPALNVLVENPVARWDNPDYDLSQADAVVLWNDVRLKVSAELGVQKTIYKRIKILTEKGKAFNEFYEPYKERQFPKINFAHAILPDGSIVTDSQQFPGILQKVPPHHRSARVLFVKMLRAEPGDILEFEMIFEEPHALKEDLAYDEFFISENLPVLKATYTVTVPAEMDLNYQSLNSSVKPIITKKPETGQREYAWTAENIAPLTIENHMPEYRQLGRSIIVSSTRTLEDVAFWWRAHAANKYKTNDQLDELIGNILAKKTTPEDKIAALYDYVKNEVTYTGFDYGWADHEPIPSLATLKNKAGDAKNQAVLLRTLLDVAGFKADIGLVRTRDLGDIAKGITGLGEFNHVMVVLKDGAKTYFLDPSESYYPQWTLPARNSQATVVIIKDESTVQTKIPEFIDAESHAEVMMDLVMDSEFMVSGTLSVEYFGSMGAKMKNSFNSWDQQRTLAFVRQQTAAYIPGAQFTQVEIFNQKNSKRNARVEIKVATTKPWIEGAGPWEVSLCGASALRQDYIKKSRKHPLKLIGLRQLFVKTRIRLPASVRIEALPEVLTEESDLLTASAQFENVNGEL